MKIKISDIKIKDRVRKDLGSLEELKKSISEFGVINPITLNEKFELIAGYRRLSSCKELGWTEFDIGKDAKIVKGLDELKEFDMQLHENLKRKDFTPLEEAEALLERKEIYEKLHPETKQYSSEMMQSVRRGDKMSPRQPSFVESTAQITNYTPRTIERKLQLNELPEKYKNELRKGVKVAKILKEVKKEKQLKDIKELKPPKGEFNVIVIDPPWQGIGGYDPDGFRGAGNHYPSMSIEEIKAIDLPIAQDCVLWLWAIDWHLKDALEIIEHWGFERKSTLIWVKDKIGMGKWLRNQHEYCFLAFKGKPVFHGENISTILHAPRREHSEKPKEFYELVEKASPYKKKLDYFARKKKEGWICYGDEVK